MLSFIIDLIVVYWVSEEYRQAIDCSLHKMVITTVKFTMLALIIPLPMRQLLHWFFEICNVIMHLILWKYGDYGCTFKSIQCGANSYTIKSDTEYKMDQSSIISYDINCINQPTSQTEFGCIINCDIGYSNNPFSNHWQIYSICVFVLVISKCFVLVIFFKQNDPCSDKICHICTMLIIMRINTIIYTPTSNANSRSDIKLHQYRIIEHKLNKHITIVFMIVNCYKFVTNIYIMDQFHHIVNIIHNFDIDNNCASI